MTLREGGSSMNLPLEKPTHSLIPKAQPKIEVPTKLGSKTIINAVVDPIADLKAQLKSHLAKSVDQDLINRIQMMAASKFLLESKEFDSVENIAQHIRKTLSLSVLDDF